MKPVTSIREDDDEGSFAASKSVRTIASPKLKEMKKKYKPNGDTSSMFTTTKR